MTISPDLVMLDTNVLVYAYYEDTPNTPPRFLSLTVPRRLMRRSV
jgi:hypothetical protein